MSTSSNKTSGASIKDSSNEMTQQATYFLANFVQALDKLPNPLYPAPAFNTAVSAHDKRARGVKG
jgi:hypothetical protein